MLSKTNQTHRGKTFMTLLICGIKLVEAESRVAVARAVEEGKWGDTGQRVQSCSCGDKEA